jgi:hypothetical protein
MTLNETIRWILAILVFIGLLLFFPTTADAAKSLLNKLNPWEEKKVEEPGKLPEYFDEFNKAIRTGEKSIDTSLTMDQIRSVISTVSKVQKLSWSGGDLYLLKASVGGKDTFLFYWPATQGIAVVTSPVFDSKDTTLYSYQEVINKYPLETLSGRLFLEKTGLFGWDWIASDYPMSPLNYADDPDSCKAGLCLPSQLKVKVEQVVK